MKYVFIVVLLIVASAGGLMGLVVVYRWSNNMTYTPRIMPGERIFVMPAGVMPRGGALIIPKEQRDVAARQPNPVRPTPESVTIGRQHFQTFCTPCHGPEGKGGVTGPVATKFIPPPDLSNAELQRQRTDGYWHSYIVVGGAGVAADGEALSSPGAGRAVEILRLPPA